MADHLPREWRLREARYRLLGNRCAQCGAKFFPPRTVCAACRSTSLEAFQFNGQGELYSFTTLRQAPAGFEQQAPYSVGMVRLDEGPLVEAQLTDAAPDAWRIGMRVAMVTRRLRADGDAGLIVYGYKFRPASI